MTTVSQLPPVLGVKETVYWLPATPCAYKDCGTGPKLAPDWAANVSCVGFTFPAVPVPLLTTSVTGIILVSFTAPLAVNVICPK